MENMLWCISVTNTNFIEISVHSQKGPCWAGRTGGHVPLRPPLIKGFLDALDELKIAIKFNDAAQKLTIVNLKNKKKVKSRYNK